MLKSLAEHFFPKDINKQGKCLFKWDNVCLPKNACGLGVKDLRQQDRTLLMKKVYKFFNHHDTPWVNLVWRAYYNNGTTHNASSNTGPFFWKDCCKLIEDFKNITTCSPNDGSSILLWNDNWHNDSMKERFPQLHSFAKTKIPHYLLPKPYLRMTYTICSMYHCRALSSNDVMNLLAL